MPGLARADDRSFVDAMQQINEQIIRRMQTGIIVIDQDETVLHCNDAARHLLGLGLQETQTITLPPPWKGTA